MSNELLLTPRPGPNSDLIDQLEVLSQRTAVAALDAVLGVLPQGGKAVAPSAAKMALLSKHVVNAAQELEPTLTIGR